jgi:hypothetical protein
MSQDFLWPNTYKSKTGKEIGIYLHRVGQSIPYVVDGDERFGWYVTHDQNFFVVHVFDLESF